MGVGLMMYRSGSYRLFTWCNTIFLTAVALTCVFPMIHIFAISLSGSAAANANLVKLIPIGFNTASYERVFANDAFLASFATSVLRTVLGMAVSMALIVMAAYALSKESSEFKGRNIWAWYFIFTMLFHGGLVPAYIVVLQVGLINSIWALVLPTAVSVFNMILLLNFFRSSVPKALAESAFMDGAGYFKTLLAIYLPISLPALATVSLFTLVYYWNEWFQGLIYMTDRTKYPMATLLQTMVVQMQSMMASYTAEELRMLSDRSFRSAQIFIAAAPVILVYPFLQRFFVKGIVLGSVKE